MKNVLLFLMLACVVVAQNGGNIMLTPNFPDDSSWLDSYEFSIATIDTTDHVTVENTGEFLYVNHYMPANSWIVNCNADYHSDHSECRFQPQGDRWRDVYGVTDGKIVLLRHESPNPVKVSETNITYRTEYKYE